MITATIKIDDGSKGQREALAKRLKGMRNASVTIGVHEDAGRYEGSDVSVVEVALWNEFGTKRIPERSFLRSALAGNEGLINQWRAGVISGIIEGSLTVEKGLETLGFRIAELVKNKIKSNVPPPLAESTARDKKARGVAPVTLIDSTLLLRSISYRVHA